MTDMRIFMTSIDGEVYTIDVGRELTWEQRADIWEKVRRSKRNYVITEDVFKDIRRYILKYLETA